MLTGFFSGISGMLYNQQKLDVTSHNLANVNTTGFRKSNMVLKTRTENPFSRSLDSAAAKRYTSTNGVQRAGVYKNFEKTGSLQQTGNPMDLGIVPELKNAFLAVRRAGDESGKVLFTRNGRLSFGPMDPSNPNSPTVLYAAGHVVVDLNNQPVQIDPSEGPLKIGEDGTIQQNGGQTGEIPVYRLNASADPRSQQSANLAAMRQLGDSLLEIPEGREEQFHPVELKVGQGGVSRLMVQGSQEASNVNIFHEMMEMMSSNRGSSANMNAIRQQIDGLTKLFELVRR